LAEAYGKEGLNMKKVMALLLALILVLSLAACEVKTPGESTQPTQTDPVASPGEKKLVQTDLWSLEYDTAAWSYDKDALYENDGYASLSLKTVGGSSANDASVEISVSVEDHEGFRNYLANNGIDAYAYAVNNAYELTKIGGVDCLQKESTYWGSDCVRYFGRVEAASVTVFIEVMGDCKNPKVEQLLAGLSIKTENIGNVDCPWPWEGTPFSAPNASAMAGTHTISSRWVPITDCIVTRETFDHAVAVVGNKAYILGEEKLRQYSFDGTSLTDAKDIAISGDFEQIQAVNGGTVWISGFMEPLVSLQDGKQTSAYEGPDNVTMHPSGLWGISWFSSSECEKITLSGGTMSTTPLKFPQVSTISTVLVDEQYIYVCGYAADDSGHKVFVYDLNGVHQMTLTDAKGESLGSITFIAQTANGFLALDGNMRRVVLWTPDGTYIGAIEDSDLFGTHYPWFCGGTKLSDGSFLVLMTEDRTDKSAMELVAFVLSGF
jgi:hypothetical protein